MQMLSVGMTPRGLNCKEKAYADTLFSKKYILCFQEPQANQMIIYMSETLHQRGLIRYEIKFNGNVAPASTGPLPDMLYNILALACTFQARHFMLATSVRRPHLTSADNTQRQEAAAGCAASQEHFEFMASPCPSRLRTFGEAESDFLILDWLVDALQDIMAIFQTYGNVKELRVLSGPDGHSSAGALVRMGSPEEAAQAIAGVNAWAASTGVGNGTFTLSVKYADSPEERAR